MKNNEIFTKLVNGKLMKYSPKYNVWVNCEGTYAYREYNDPNPNGSLKIHQRADGSKFLNTKSPGIIELDKLVADCFMPMPQDGKMYIHALVRVTAYPDDLMFEAEFGNNHLCSKQLEYENTERYINRNTRQDQQDGLQGDICCRLV